MTKLKPWYAKPLHRLGIMRSPSLNMFGVPFGPWGLGEYTPRMFRYYRSQAARSMEYRSENFLLRDALRTIGTDCENVIDGNCVQEGRTRGAEYGAEKWCHACVAADALGLR